MKCIKLIAREDLSLGELGLMVKTMKQIHTPMVASEGLIIAHDLLEHVNGIESIGSVDDELEALGGVWFVRGQTGMLRRESITSPIGSLAYDICNLGEIYLQGVNFRTPVPRTYSHMLDDTFEDIINGGITLLKRELQDQEDPIDYKRLMEYETACIHYLRTGFRKATRRHVCSDFANHQFWLIADAVDPYTKDLEIEGQEFILRYDNNVAWCEDYYPEDLYN